MIHAWKTCSPCTIVLPAVVVGLIAALFGLSRVLSPEGLQSPRPPAFRTMEVQPLADDGRGRRGGPGS